MDQLSALQPAALAQYLHGVVDGYIGRSTFQISDEETLKKMPHPSSSKTALFLCTIFEQISQGNDIEKYSNSVTCLETMKEIAIVRKKEIDAECKKRAILSGLQNSLSYFDWSLRIIKSSSKMQSVSIPVVLLTLTFSDQQKTTLQLNEKQLKQFIDTLTCIQKVVKELSKKKY